MKKIFLFCAIVALMLSYSCTHQQQPQQAVAAENEPTPVEQHGALSVQGRYIVDSKGEKVQLRGVSFGWHNWWHRFFNEAAVTKMAKEWKASVVRCSIGLDLDDNCYDKNPELAYATVDSMVNAAVKNGIYIIVDFHSHKNNLPLAKEFFGVVSKKYGNIPNIIYEIWNEPLEVEWAETKAYSEELIPVIRANAPDAIVIVPTPRWDQEVDKAADDPITKFGNLVYSLHHYSATHKEYLLDKVRYAVGKGLPLFISESGGMLHTGDGILDMDSWETWLDFARENSISWVAWSISDKKETCSMLVPGTPADGSQWTEECIKPWGVLVRHYLQTGR